MAFKELIRSIKEKITEFGKLTPIALVTTFLPIAGSSMLLLFGYPLGVWLRENWEIGVPAYLLGVLVFCGLALLPTNVIGILGGWAFSFDLGLFILMIGIVGASFISFVIHRRIVGDKVPELAEKHPKAQAVYEALLGKSFLRTTLIIFLIRISIIMPFAFTNFLLASAKVSWKSFLAGTLLGMLPRSSAVVFAGASLSELSLDRPTDKYIIAFGLAATVASMIVCSLIGRRALDAMTKKESAA